MKNWMLSFLQTYIMVYNSFIESSVTDVYNLFFYVKLRNTTAERLETTKMKASQTLNKDHIVDKYPRFA